MEPVEVRGKLVDALRLDLVGPDEGLGDPHEALPTAPSRWYLTGFIVPFDAGESQRRDEDDDDEPDETSGGGTDDATAPDTTAARRANFPSSVGLSTLLPESAETIDVTVSWGDYTLLDSEGGVRTPWRREPKQKTIRVPIPKDRKKQSILIPGSGGLHIDITTRPVSRHKGLPDNTRSVSVFLVNYRMPAPDERRDEAFAFQVQLAVRTTDAFTPQPNLQGIDSNDWDVTVADLQYRDCFEFAVGHSIATTANVVDERCHEVRTCWLPEAEVEKTAVPPLDDAVELSMLTLSVLKDSDDAQRALGGFSPAYRAWIDGQRELAPTTPEQRAKTSRDLLANAECAAGRIQEGVDLLSDPVVLDAFRIANRVMAAQAARRLAIEDPKWRPFQLAFLLMNMRAIVEPEHDDREIVDLLFFPTGGGKTEAYLGLAAFTLVLRRMRNPGVTGAGLTVIMRYTLRLLTLDQLGRAASLICALELEREKDSDKLGDWPFEIGLWVGQAATPNRMGRKGDGQAKTARAKTIAFQNNDKGKPSPIPLEECPWCGEKFTKHSFKLIPNEHVPHDLRVNCMNRECDFSGRSDRNLPIVSVDEPVYRRLPCFMIATVDKFAALPWTGEVGQFFGKVDRHDPSGFYGPSTPGVGRPLDSGQLLPPELIIQDELHLISGPLGTVAGLYETAMDELATRKVGDKTIRPKIVASTATVRRADDQIRALFGRSRVDVFPPPGPDRRDSFFAETVPVSKANARLYVGIAAQGRPTKKLFLRANLALMAAAQKLYNGFKKDKDNPVDPYMTLLGYFNSLRELGGSRRLCEDEISNALAGYGVRKRLGEGEGLFSNRKISYDVLELTSRVSTDKVSDAKRRLAQVFSDEKVDIALATNMISVGLDITRLGLMVVFGQPKTSSEYIQATSRVGRDDERPGACCHTAEP